MNGEIDSNLLKSLEKTCGASCYHSPVECECFIPMPKEIAEELGICAEDLLPIITTMEECAFYDKQAYIINEINNNIKNIIKKSLLGASDENLEKYYSIAIEKHFKGESFTHDIAMMYALDSMSDNTFVDEREQYVYLLHTDIGIKIGKSYTPHKRASSIGVKLPVKILKTETFKVLNMSKVETYLHNKYKDFRLNGEWFSIPEDKVEHVRDDLERLAHSFGDY